ncbi:MAG: glycosyltransferase family 2 protein [Ignavibacterium sp.]|nr:glycosyltransferase family 2 protein [Ignavibacterium sp.]MEB2354493.1 glycosyltransferase family 2 protein [Ignavibacteriales bacterium]GIK23111.1 MAG: glycosyl transferase [Ignavibacteriota bacterium]
MQTKNKISAVIITGNEEKNIKDCLQSVTWADEIIVVDSESIDNTVKIAKEFTDKVFVQKWLGYAKQKSYAISLAKNEWVISLDADERVTEALKDEILSFNLDNTKYSAFKIKRENYFIGKKINGCGWGNDYQLRLFRKSGTRVDERLVHEKFIVEGEVAELKNPILHYSYNNLKEGFDKINVYSSLEAEEKFNKKKVSTLRIIFYPVFAFLHHYLFRKGIKDGKHGLMISLMHAVTKLQVQMKIWELKQK